MKYYHPNSNLIINANGGHRLYNFLESRGWKTEEQSEVESKAEEKKEKLKAFVNSIPTIEKICPICKEKFETKNPRTRTNSVKCGQILRRQEGR